MPSRSTIVPHMSRFNPPFAAFRASVSFCFNVSHDGRFLQPFGSPWAIPKPKTREKVRPNINETIGLFIVNLTSLSDKRQARNASCRSIRFQTRCGVFIPYLTVDGFAIRRDRRHSAGDSLCDRHLGTL